MTDILEFDAGPPQRDGGARAMVRDYGARLRRREAVLPVLLIAGGALWLATSLTRDTRIGRQLHLDGPLRQAQAASAALRARVADTAGQLKAEAEDVGAAAAAGLDGLRDKAATLGDLAQDRVRRTTQRYDAAMEAEPLVLGAVGIAIGVGLAILWPVSAAERRLFGGAASRLADRAKAGLGDVRSVVEQAVTQAKDELHRQTGGEGETDLTGKVAAVVHAGAEAAADAVAPAASKPRRSQGTLPDPA